MFRHLLFLLPILWATALQAQTPYPYDGVKDDIIRKHYVYLCDSNNILTPQQALQLFRQGQGKVWAKATFNVGINPYLYWFYLPVHNITSTSQEAIFRFHTSLSGLQFFSIAKDSLKLLFSGNSYLSVSKRPFRHQDLTIPLHLPPQATATYLFRVDRRNQGLYMPLSLRPVEAVLRTEMSRAWGYGIYIGIFLFAAIFNLFLYLSLRDRIHLWYVSYVLCEIGFIVADEHYYTELFPERWIRFFENAGAFPFSALLIGCGIRIMQLLLGQNAANSRLYRPTCWATKFSFAVAAVIFVLSFFNPVTMRPYLTIAHRTVDGLFVVGMVLMIGGAIEKVVQKQRLAVYYLLSILPLLAGATLFFLNHLGITNWNPVQPNGIVVGFAVEIIMLAILLSVRYHYFKKEKELLLIRLNEQQQETIDKVIATQEQERKRIAEDLHDDVGATLSALLLHISSFPENEPTGEKTLREFHQKTLALSTKAANDVRTISHNLLPRDFESQNLFGILQSRVQELNQPQHTFFYLITDGDTGRLTGLLAVSLYRIINELLTNIVKHAQASEATLQLLISEEQVQIISEDNGIGMQQSSSNPKGIGLQNITSRVQFWKGTVNIDSNSNGTSVIIGIPL